MNDPHPGHAIAAGIPGAVLVVLSGQWPGAVRGTPLGYVLLTCGVVLLVVALSIMLVWLASEFVIIWRDFRRGDSITPELLLIEERGRLINGVRDLDEAGKRIVIENGTIMGQSFALMDDEPYIKGTNVPYWFFYDWLSKCDDVFLASTGSWAEGTNERTWAQELTRLFVVRGQATEARDGRQWTGGNRPARWLNSVVYRDLVQYYGERL